MSLDTDLFWPKWAPQRKTRRFIVVLLAPFLFCALMIALCRFIVFGLGIAWPLDESSKAIIAVVIGFCSLIVIGVAATWWVDSR